MDDIKKLLKSNDIPTNHLADVIRLHFESKEWLAESLGLNKDNNWRYEIPLPDTLESKPNILGLLRAVEYVSGGKYTVLDLNFMWKGKNKVRATKAIQDVWADIYELYSGDTKNDDEYMVYRSTYEFLHSLPVPLDDSLLLSGRTDTKVFASMLCQYGDMVKNGRIGVISIHPYDYFTLSGHGCTFNSCVKVGGEYFNTCLSYLNSDCVAVAYCRDAGQQRKVGRSLIYMNENAVFMGRVYGAFAKSDLLLLRSYIQDCLGGEWVKRAENLQSSDFRKPDNIYVDTGYGIYTYRKGADVQKFDFGYGVCLKCAGDIIGHPDGGICDDCGDDDRCCNCNERIRNDDYRRINGDIYCDDCYGERFFYCECCDRDRDSDDSTRVITRRGGEVWWCSRCIENHTFFCDSCEDTFDANYYHSYDVDGSTYCNTCFDDNCGTCSDCEENFMVDDLTDGLCFDCIKEREARDGDRTSIDAENSGTAQ